MVAKNVVGLFYSDSLFFLSSLYMCILFLELKPLFFGFSFINMGIVNLEGFRLRLIKGPLDVMFHKIWNV